MKSRIALLILVIVSIAGSIYYLESQKVEVSESSIDEALATLETLTGTSSDKAKKYEPAKEITSPDGFINTDQITIGELVGDKVVLVDFWTYSCINCQRTTPYLNAWYEKYRDQGLEIIGLHTPEFEFEKDYDNVQAAVEKFGIKYPVVLDNDYSTWTAYRNRYWPRKYLIDIDGYIVYDHIGEGGYEETERKIQELLEERAVMLREDKLLSSDFVNPEGTEVSRAQSPELYFGSLRNSSLGNGQPNVEGVQIFGLSSEKAQDLLYMSGGWNIHKEFAENQTENDTVSVLYRAMKVFMVARADQPVRVQVLIDGKPAGDKAGADVINGFVTIEEDKLYRLVEDPEGVDQHILELVIADPGLQAFTFTFG